MDRDDGRYPLLSLWVISSFFVGSRGPIPLLRGCLYPICQYAPAEATPALPDVRHGPFPGGLLSVTETVTIRRIAFSVCCSTAKQRTEIQVRDLGSYTEWQRDCMTAAFHETTAPREVRRAPPNHRATSVGKPPIADALAREAVGLGGPMNGADFARKTPAFGRKLRTDCAKAGEISSRLIKCEEWQESTRGKVDRRIMSRENRRIFRRPSPLEKLRYGMEIIGYADSYLGIETSSDQAPYVPGSEPRGGPR